MSFNIQDSDVGRTYGALFSEKNKNKKTKGWLRDNYTPGELEENHIQRVGEAGTQLFINLTPGPAHDPRDQARTQNPALIPEEQRV